MTDTVAFPLRLLSPTPLRSLRVRSQHADGIVVLKDNPVGLGDGLRYTFRVADKARRAQVEPSKISGGEAMVPFGLQYHIACPVSHCRAERCSIHPQVEISNASAPV